MFMTRQSFLPTINLSAFKKTQRCTSILRWSNIKFKPLTKIYHITLHKGLSPTPFQGLSLKPWRYSIWQVGLFLPVWSFPYFRVCNYFHDHRGTEHYVQSVVHILLFTSVLLINLKKCVMESKGIARKQFWGFLFQGVSIEQGFRVSGQFLNFFYCL